MSVMSEQPSSPTPSPSPPPPPTDWRPPRHRDSNVASIVVGLVILGLGIWYFLDQTLGFTMPDVDWGDLWPVFLIAIGGLVIFRAATGRDR
jgi:LiaI-LiaF-like transmembrane region